MNNNNNKNNSKSITQEAVIKKSRETTLGKAMKKKVKPSKPMVVWSIVDNEVNPDMPITFTSTKDEAIIALDQYLYLKHYKHFRAWCALRDLKVDHTNNWKEYAKNIIHTDQKGHPVYVIVKIDYGPDMIASLLRYVSDSPIMGCPFDTEEEIAAYSEYLSDKAIRVERGEDHFTPIEEAIDLFCSDATHQDPVRPPEPDLPRGGRNDA